MFYKFKLMMLCILTIVMSLSVVYAERLDTGWKGYGLYNLSKSEVSISNEADTVTINEGNATAIYEYTINNNSGKNITVNFGYPDNGIYKFSVHDGSKFLSYKTRDTAYLKSNYGVQNLQTPEGRWFLFNMIFTPGQTRTIKVSIEAEMKKAENDTYGLSFLKDRSYNYAINAEKSSFTLKLTDFRPYAIFDLEGLKPEDIAEDGTVMLSYSGSFGSGFSLNYQPIDKMAIDRVNASAYKKPKAIVKAFNEKKYEEAVKLSDEYLSAPSDERLSLEQVKYVKAESSRLMNKNEDYLSLIEQLEVSKLYPGRIRYKVLIDKLQAYDAKQDKAAVDSILKVLIPETQQGYPYLYYWLDKNGYRVAADVQPDADIVTHTESTGKPASGKGLDILGAAVKFLTTIRESKWTYAVIGLLAGFILGRFSKRGKKRKSVYLFRN